MILNEARIHKYTCTNHELSVLNIKILQFEFKFRYIEFCSGIINVDAEAVQLMIHRRHLALRRRPQQQSTPMAPPSMGPSRPASGPPTSSRPQRHRKEEMNYQHILKSIRQSLSN
jgi:hypothetical protein